MAQKTIEHMIEEARYKQRLIEERAQDRSAASLAYREFLQTPVGTTPAERAAWMKTFDRLGKACDLAYRRETEAWGLP